MYRLVIYNKFGIEICSVDCEEEIDCITELMAPNGILNKVFGKIYTPKLLKQKSKDTYIIDMVSKSRHDVFNTFVAKIEKSQQNNKM